MFDWVVENNCQFDMDRNFVLIEYPSLWQRDSSFADLLRMTRMRISVIPAEAGIQEKGHRKQEVDMEPAVYIVHLLVWYELHETMESAILREKRIKEWKRVWKLRMIESGNPAWKDLYHSIV